jgi:hypothetical protein
VIEVVEAASTANASRHAELYRGQTDKIGRDVLKNSEERNEKLFRNLIQYARRQGQPPHELLAIFGVRGFMDHMSEPERKAWYENAVKNVDSLNPALKKNPQAKMEHFFSLAKGVLEDEALRLYATYGKTFAMAWQSVEYVAPIYARRGNSEAAWVAIESNLQKWWPMDNAQVAPLFLLLDENLEKLMTTERCQLVISTPRGPEGAKAGK